MKTILVPTDFSNNATNDLNYAAALASWAKGHIIILHAIELQAFCDAWGQIAVKPDVRLEPYYYAKLNQISGQLRLENGFKFTVETVCVHGELRPNLEALVKSKNVDLVVMGTQGAGTFGQKIFGTQTVDFIRVANCPVLAVPAKARYHEMTKIVFASDLEREEEIFLNQLRTFTQTFNLTYLTILNIKSEDRLNIVPDEQMLAEINTILSILSYKVVQLENKKVVPGIWEYINQNQPDILAISIRKRDLLENLLHDSVSEKLLYQQRLPLLALPERRSSNLENKFTPKQILTEL